MSDYIPDLTERFPEGFGGVDMTDRYCNNLDDLRELYKMHQEDLWHAEMERERAEYEDRNYRRLYDE